MIACSKVYFDIKGIKQTISHEFVHSCLRLKNRVNNVLYVMLARDIFEWTGD